MKIKYNLVFILSILFINIFYTNIFAYENEEIIKVGIYEYAPYIIINSDGEISGYYNDYLNLIKEKYDFKYEYVVSDIYTLWNKLESREIDVMMGAAITPENKNKFIFSEHSVGEEQFSIYSDKNIDIDDLENIDIIRVAMLENEANEKWIIDFFKSRNISTENIITNNYKKLQQILEDNEADIIIDSSYNYKGKNKIYTFTSYPLYIAGNKESLDIIESLDKYHEQLGYKYYIDLRGIHKKYFIDNVKVKNNIILWGIIIINLAVGILYVYPKVKKKLIKNKIKNRMKNEQYFLQYQPIYNPKNEEVIGFEALLRLLDKDNKIIAPFKFIPEIEQNDMLFDISIWILEKIIKDYDEIKKYKCVKNSDFYISCNISLNEIENDDFVKKAIKILNKYSIGYNKICLEVIERIKISNSEKLLKNVSLLKEAGFKIAIDDFGVEYSNLDVVVKLDADIIKIDKYFVDGIGKDKFKNEIILYISKIANSKNKFIVLEGVEEKYQHEIIEKIDYNFTYVQGYFYNKPMNIKDIKYI